MLFNTTQFFLFLALVLALFYLAPLSLRRWILLAASYYFYICWNAKFLLLLLTLTVTDYLAALWIARSSGTTRRAALIAGLSANLAFLGYFKYYNLFARTAAQTLGMPADSFVQSIVLPMGISFHTFQSMSYIVDVYRRQQEPIRNPLDYALFIAFFPQLVAGPIVRANEFFKDLFAWRPPNIDEVLRGLLLIVLGLTKKMALADQFALVADAYFKDPGAMPGLRPAWGAVTAFAGQIFFDFSGYSDIAIGSAKLLGFHFPTNFERPYLAASITEFWRRWHISLSRWLRDYLYISLGGNRYGSLATYRNLMITMLLGGLWHGASWNFVFWGGYHGLLLSIERITGWNRVKEKQAWRVPVTFILVCIGWVFFRATTFADSLFVLSQMFTTPDWGLGWGLTWWHLGLAAGALILALREERYGWFERTIQGPAWKYAAVVFMLLACLEIFGVTDLTVPFVYFQF